ncbi:hypothetical protein RCL_jg23700.t1 [Rhizophagus clarus]|uniref:Uncharacterized protein n=1 Tax=Rhizophagus clarus TaxID=94130 RepID=A0A8H3L6R4_9GLOM|nr:hypothetical protein RCL_jg23700.t1 [Rhizophagus clarus]
MIKVPLPLSAKKDDLSNKNFICEKILAKKLDQKGICDRVPSITGSEIPRYRKIYIYTPLFLLYIFDISKS